MQTTQRKIAHALALAAALGVLLVAGIAGCQGAIADAEPTTPPPTTDDASAPLDALADARDAAPLVPKSAVECFGDLRGAVPGPDYDRFHPRIMPSCAGTDHQTITGVQKVVFLGDSITEGTPPTQESEYYRTRVVDGLTARFGPIESADCAAYGARTDDLLAGKNQLATCFPTGKEDKRTLVVMTMGGNDVATWAKAKLSTPDAMVAANLAADQTRAAIDWLQAPGRFPNGVFVVFANVYEYTDTSGDLSSCPSASFAGVSGSWPDGAAAVVHFQERLMEMAVATRTDMLFLFEHFCGHGFKRDDPSLQCYRGPNTELWFDLTCIHPTPRGHQEIASMVLDVVDGI
jgi:lysophospholipase L1-like esterase